jgi:hypothetical protein
MLAPLVAGFMLTATGVFALAAAVGAGVRQLSLPIGTALLIFVLGACLITDLVFPRIRPTLLNRQTPRTLSGRFSLPVVGLLWGADAGTVVSTFRVTAGSWGALLLTAAGWAPWWTGVYYGVAFCLPLAVLVIAYPTAGGAAGERGWRRRSTESLAQALSSRGRLMRLSTALATAIAIGVVLSG